MSEKQKIKEMLERKNKDARTKATAVIGVVQDSDFIRSIFIPMDEKKWKLWNVVVYSNEIKIGLEKVEA